MKLRIEKTEILYLFLLLSISLPGYFRTQISGLAKLWQWYFILCFFITAFLVYKRFSMKDIKGVLFPILLYVWLIVVTIIKNGLVNSAIIEFLYFTYGFMLASLGLRENTVLFVKTVRNILFVLYIINFISVLLYPNGLYGSMRANGTMDYRYWFLGFKNGLGKYAIVLIVMSAIYYCYTKKAASKWILFGSILLSFFTGRLVESSSSVVTTIGLAVLIFLVIKLKEKLPLVMRMKNYGIIIVALFFMVVITDVLLSNNVVTYIVTQLLGEKITLSGRTAIWKSVFRIISRNPILGIGVQGSVYNARLIGVTANTTDAHNFYLEYMLEGGVVALVLLVLIFLQIIRRLDKYREKEVAGILSIGLFITMIIFLVEHTSIYYMWLFFGICLNVEYMLGKNCNVMEGKKKNE